MKAPTPLEWKQQAAFVQLVKQTINPHWRFTHIPLGEWRDIRTAMKLLRMGVMPGWPDFIFVGPDIVFFLELKRKRGGRVLSEQTDIRDHIMRSACCSYLLIDSIEDVVDTLVDLGIIRRAQVAA
jgi:hypothetical protein